GVVSGSCTYPGGTTSCRAASCASGVATIAASCDGAGACPPITSKICAPFGCSGSVCAGGCTVDTDCAPGNFCSAGTCQPLLTVGNTCATTKECASGFCVDGVCCDRSCD